ncbi:MAG: T9SS type A sorting domain-containing protein [Bacteroidota bacterium]
MLIRNIFLLFFTIAISFHGFSQEIVTGLFVNPVVQARAAALKQQNQITPDGYSQAGLDTIPMNLPFLDDFSSLGVFPSDQRWIDHFAFENDDYPVFPVNIGAMTLDAINDSGKMYPEAVPGPAIFIADHLTSRYIRLDSVFSPAPKALTPADSVFLSFYYQPQGRGQAPQYNDSLILQFLVKPGHDSLIPGGGIIKVPDLWQRIWYSNGMSLDTFYVRNNKWFARVMLPITDTVFFSKKFRFRFYNYVSLASSAEPSWQSNTDQWNIDQVYLNLGRTGYDTVFPELRFIQRPSYLLRNYSAMPYPQYCDDPTNELRDTLDVLMSNRDLIPHMSAYNYFITQSGGTFSKSYSGGNYNIQPYNLSPYVTYQKFAHPEFPFLLPVNNTDSAVFLIKHVVKDITPGSTFGDTVQTIQRFYNYYSYDDGTPEASYGLTPAGSKLAYSFKLNISPDTLRAIRIYFNQTLSETNDRFFYLCVWNDNAGKPGDTIYSDLVYPRYSDSLNKFVTYHLYPPLAITGTFYVGCIQTTGDNLSIGYDRYNNSQQSIFYNTYGIWSNSAYSGSLLIRPVVGKPIPLGTNDIITGDVRMSVYPNPCSGNALQVKIRNATNNRAESSVQFSILDLTGRINLKGDVTGAIDVSSLCNGIYFLEVKNHSGMRIGITKVIIAK